MGQVALEGISGAPGLSSLKMSSRGQSGERRAVPALSGVPNHSATASSSALLHRRDAHSQRRFF